jgi:hypothetical protein
MDRASSGSLFAPKRSKTTPKILIIYCVPIMVLSQTFRFLDKDITFSDPQNLSLIPLTVDASNQKPKIMKSLIM